MTIGPLNTGPLNSTRISTLAPGHRLAGGARFPRRLSRPALCTLLLAVVALVVFASKVMAQPSPPPSQRVPRKTLVVGSEEDFPPFAIGKSNGPASGFTVELWRAVAAEAGLDYTIRVLPFRQVLDEFRSGEIDVMINLAQSDERRAFSDFSVPHVVVQGAIFVRKGESRIHSEADLADKSIIVIDGDLAHDYAISKGWKSQLALVRTAADGLSLLASGRHDAMLLSKLPGMETLLRLKIPNVKPLPAKAGFAQKFSFAVRKGNAELLASINEGLSLAKSSGIYDILYEKWFRVFEIREVTFRDMLKYVGPVAIGLLVFIGIILVRQNEREKAAHRIRESEERYRRIVETAAEGVVTLDPEGRTTFANPKMAKMLGYSVEELIGKKLSDLAGDEEPIDYAKARKRGFAEQYDFKFRRKDGSALWTFIATNPIFDAGGADLGTLAMVTDISERKLAENALRREKELSEAATRIGTLIHAKLDPAIILQCVVERGAAALGSDTAAIAEREGDGWMVRYVHGMPPETVGMRLDPERERHIILAIEKIEVVPVSDASNDSRVNREHMNRYRVRSVLAAPITIRGEPVGVFFFQYHAVPHGFTAAEMNFALQLGLSAGIALENARLFEKQNRAQEELRKAQEDLTRTNLDLERLVTERTAKLQETIAELEHFSYSITHDMRAPLRAMQGFATILNEETAHGLSDEHKDYLNRIGSVAGRMDRLIIDALNFSKTVRQELVSERVDVLKLVRGIVGSYPELERSGAQIEIPNEIPQVIGNVAGLTQCFSNLLGNAVKFVKPGQRPEIRIWAEHASLGEGEGREEKNLVTGRKEHAPSPQWVRIWVEDNGVGISKNFQPRVFDMFQRESEQHEGTGIGLALVRKVTERMGGKVGVESEPGQGSRFWLILKAA